MNDLFERKEIKRQCHVVEANFLQLKCKEWGLERQLFNGFDYERILTIAFDKDDAENQDFENYSRLRVRKYYNPLNLGNCFYPEVRKRIGQRVVKKRVKLYNSMFNDFMKGNNRIDDIENQEDGLNYLFCLGQLTNQIPYFVLDYKREAWNGKGLRVTIDSDFKYYNIDSTKKFYQGKQIGKIEDIAIVKFKTDSEFPDSWKKTIYDLKKPISKMKEGLKFLGAKE